ncbi:hypothetical protein [Nocardia tengchongensis]
MRVSRAIPAALTLVAVAVIDALVALGWAVRSATTSWGSPRWTPMFVFVFLFLFWSRSAWTA